jgi:2Fe-2S type ferredoxin
MPELIHFHTDLYRREALATVAAAFRDRARVDLEERDAAVVARLEPLGDASGSALRDEFCNEALSATLGRLRAGSEAPARGADGPDAPPWALLAPLTEGMAVGLDWVLESLGPIRSGAATIVFRHPRHGIARVALRRNQGAPLGVAATDHLDFLLLNGGSGTAQTEESICRVLAAVAATLRQGPPPDPAVLEALEPHSERSAAPGSAATAPAGRRVAPRVDADAQTIRFDVPAIEVSRLSLYDAVLRFANRCYVFLSRGDADHITIEIRPRTPLAEDALRVLVRDVTAALNRVARGAVPGAGGGLPPLAPRRLDLDRLLAELAAADPRSFGLGFVPERGPGHSNLRVLNLRGTGACNSECVFCIEKFNPTHRPMPKADATRQLILDSAGKFDMLFFASGEPTIHPKLFEYVALAREVGFTAFGMSSHFRTFADPRFALRTLQAGFEFFDIALHAADPEAQLAVNPIGDGGASLYEALHGLTNLLHLADALGIRVSITQKIVVSRLNVTQLEQIFRATYDRGVRHFILQPVRAIGLAPDLQAKLAITEEEILPHLNALLRATQGMGAVIKPYGFSRQHLFEAGHVETEQNRVKNIYGKARRKDAPMALPASPTERPRDAGHWVELRTAHHGSFCFAASGDAPLLDQGLAQGLVLPFGCRMGSCGMCCARLIDGEVDQHTQIFLSDEQVAQGFVLLCQAKPRSDLVVELCDEEEIDLL